MNRICVFCGSNTGAQPEFANAARELGSVMAARHLELVYGGGKVGLMGVLANAVLERGGAVIGVIPQALVDKELAHTGLTQLRVVHSMHQRKALMAELSDGFIALPGGYGTLEEFCEVLTWCQLGFHQKPCALLNVLGFYDPLLDQIDRAVQSQFIPPAHRSLLQVAEKPEAILNCMMSYRAPAVEKWIDRDEV